MLWVMNDDEKWLPVVGFEGLYEVSNYGVVRSLPRPTRVRGGGTRILSGRIIKTYIAGNMGGKSGHVAINLIPKEGRRVRIHKTRVHCLVLEAFVGPRPEGYYGCHNDGNHLNNHVSNLRWDTPSANNYDKVTHGDHSYAKRTTCDNGGHPLDGVWKKPDGSFKQRYCKTCHRARTNAQKAAKRAEKAA